MRKKEKRYRMIIGALAMVIILQWVFMLMGRPRRAQPPVVKKPAAATFEERAAKRPEGPPVVAVKVTRPKPKPAQPVPLKGKIAIVLDDWGYNLNNMPLASRIKYPMTAAVLPNLSYSRKVARDLHRSGWQIILHLPLEPHSRSGLEKNTILVTMDQATVEGILDRDLAGLDYVTGVSGHMGSMATEDEEIMGVIFRDLLKRRLYFLDSYVTSNSVCLQVARGVGLPFARRDVFLDNKLDREYIKKQIYQLKTKARINGQAIGIGHDRKVTLEVLKEVMPELAKEGYEFVYVSELVK